MFTLKNFEKQVNETLLKRGKEYYEEGAVTDIEETEKNAWNARVEGTETYTVEVTFKNNNSISEYFCNCPYDGPMCKHVVAVFFALREETDKPKPKKTGTSHKTVFERLVQQISLKEYQDFMLKYAAKNKSFGTEFELWFADKDGRINVGKNYTDLLQKLIKKHTERGYVDYRNARSLSREVEKLLDTGYDFVNKTNYKDAFALAKAVLNEMVPVIEYSDDSNGEIQGTIDNAVALIDSIADARETAWELKEKILKFLQTELGNKQYLSYGDFGYDMLDIFQKLAVQLNQPEAFLSFIDARLRTLTGRAEGHYRNTLLTKKMEFLESTGRKEEAEKLVRENMDMVLIRQKVVSEAMDRKDFGLAKTLIREGIGIARKKKHPDMVSEWQKALLQIAVVENDLETIRKYAKHFAFDSMFNREYYLLWKNTYTDAEWKAVIEQHIQKSIEYITSDATKDKQWDFFKASPVYSLAPVFIEEKYWDRLMELVKKENKLETTLQFHDYLAKIYPSELLEIYLPLFEREGEKVNSRPEYAALATRMQKVMHDIPEGKERIRAIARDLIRNNPRRRALIEEMNKVL